MTSPQKTSQKVPLESWEVGAELLDILSRGLYSDALSAVREYVQNGVDAQATYITITVDGPKVLIRDDGSGMNEETVRAARRFGLSDKSPRQNVGFRGIGIYSAFGICRTMTITSKQAGMTQQVGWRFDFETMRSALEADKKAVKRQRVGLAEVLTQHTDFIAEEYSGDPADSFTLVELDGLGEEFRSQLNDAAKVSRYLLNTIPVAFPNKEYGGQINEWLQQYVGLKPVNIFLRLRDEPEFPLEPPVASNVFEPEYTWIEDRHGNRLAFVWYGLSRSRFQVSSPGNQSDVSGFLMKMKGFTLGDRSTVKPFWPAVGGRTLYHHYTGELHILDAAGVYPNAARDDLEPGQATQSFIKAASDMFRILSAKANAVRAAYRAQYLVAGYQQSTADLRSRQASSDDDPFEAYRQTMNEVENLNVALRELEKSLKPGRGRQPPNLTDAQTKVAQEATTDVNAAIRDLNAVAQGAQRRIERRSESKPAIGRRPPPQTAVLERAYTALKEIAETKKADPNVTIALSRLESAVQLHSLVRAIAAIEELMASGVETSPTLEGARRELRTFMGWMAIAPVSLEEAASLRGFTPETPREEKLLHALDRGLLNVFNGRGAPYDTALGTVSEAIEDEFGT